MRCVHCGMIVRHWGGKKTPYGHTLSVTPQHKLIHCQSSRLSVRVGVVGNISACHADAPGSIPGRGVLFIFFLGHTHITKFDPKIWTGVWHRAPTTDTLPEWLRGSPAKWVVFDRRGSNPLGVVRNMGYWRNWKRASLARTRYWDRNPDTPKFAFVRMV